MNLSSTKNVFISALFELLMATKLTWTRRLLLLAVTVVVIFPLHNIINCATHEVLPFHPCFTISFICLFLRLPKGYGIFSFSSFVCLFCYCFALNCFIPFITHKGPTEFLSSTISFNNFHTKSLPQWELEHKDCGLATTQRSENTRISICQRH